jgi:isopenicillin N synthase-like dioxygenase
LVIYSFRGPQLKRRAPYCSSVEARRSAAPAKSSLSEVAAWFTTGALTYPEANGNRPDLLSLLPNLFPEDMPQLRRAVADYWRSMEELSGRINCIFALALGLDEDFFVARSARHVTNMRSTIIRRRIAPRPSQLREGAHSDYGAFTILCCVLLRSRSRRRSEVSIVAQDRTIHRVIPW